MIVTSSSKKEGSKSEFSFRECYFIRTRNGRETWRKYMQKFYENFIFFIKGTTKQHDICIGPSNDGERCRP